MERLEKAMKKETNNFKIIIIIVSITGALFFISFTAILGVSAYFNHQIKENGVKGEAICTDKERVVGRYNRRDHHYRITYTYTFEVTSPDEYKGNTFSKKGLSYGKYKIGDTVTAYYYKEHWNIF